MAAVQGNKNAVAVQWLCSGSGKQQWRKTSITTVKRLAGHEASTPTLRRLRPPCKFPIPSSKFIQKKNY
ncbi:hypothetical protein ACFX16_041282 [Malus domestica]